MRGVDHHTKVLRKLPHQAWVLLKPTTNEDDVRFVLLKDILCDVAVLDTINDTDDDLVTECSFDGSREVSMSSPWLVDERRELLARVVAGRRDINEIDTALCEETSEFDGILELPRRLVEILKTVSSRDTTELRRSQWKTGRSK